MHNKGVIAENYMNDARKKIAKTLKVQEKEICFTSGGTESNNLAIIGTAEANKRSGMHVITTAIEHPSVSNTMVRLEEHGYEVTYLPVDAYGVISLEDLKVAIRPDTILVSLMHVNNEIGAVEPVAEAGDFDQTGQSTDAFSCGCDSVLWQNAYLSIKNGHRSVIGKWT